MLVGRGGMAPTHFFYHLTFPEAAAFICGMEEKEKCEWERVRMHVFKVAQILGGENIEPTDIMCLPWDGDKTTVKVDEKELERIRLIARRIENE